MKKKSKLQKKIHQPMKKKKIRMNKDYYNLQNLISQKNPPKARMMEQLTKYWDIWKRRKLILTILKKLIKNSKKKCQKWTKKVEKLKKLGMDTYNQKFANTLPMD